MLTTEELRQIASQEDIPLSLLLATYHVESSSGTDPRSKVPHDGGIVGPFQMSPATFKEMVGEGKDINDEYMNAVAAARYLKQGLLAHGGDSRKAYMYFHGGPNTAIWGPKTNAAADKAMAFLGQMENFSGRISEAVPSKAALSVEKGTAMVSASETLDYNKLIEQVTADSAASRLALEKSLSEMQTQQQSYNEGVAEKQKALERLGPAYQALYSAIAMQQGKKALGSMNTLSALGLDNEDVTNLQAQMSTRLKQDVETLIPMRQAITDKANQIPQFTTNPLGWLLGSLALRKDIAAHNNLLAETQQNKKLFDILTSTASNIEAVNAAKSAAGEASKALATGIVEQERINVQLAETKAEAAKAAQTFATAEFQQTMQTLRFAELNLALLERVDARRDTAELREARLNMETAQLAAHNEALAMLGYQKMESIAAFNKLPIKTRQAVDTIEKSGGMKFGKDFTEAYENASAGDPRRMTNDTKAMVAISESLMTQISKEQKDKMQKDGRLFQSLKPEEKREIINAEMRDKFEQMQMKTNNQPIDGMKSNPYAAPPVEQMLKDPDFGKTKLAASIKARQQVAPSMEITPEMVVAIAKEELKTGDYKGSVEAATADLYMYFQRVMAFNNQAFMFEKWNLPKQTRYGIAGVDYGKRTEIVKDLVKSLPYSGTDIFKLAVPEITRTYRGMPQSGSSGASGEASESAIFP